MFQYIIVYCFTIFGSNCIICHWPIYLLSWIFQNLIALHSLYLEKPLHLDCWLLIKSLRPKSCPKPFTDNLQKIKFSFSWSQLTFFFYACYILQYFWTTNSLRILMTYNFISYVILCINLLCSKYFLHEHQGKSWETV